MVDLVSLANAISSASSRIKAFCLASAKVSVDHEKRIAVLEAKLAVRTFTVAVSGTAKDGNQLTAVVTP